MVWLDTCCQLPLVVGETGGREVPSAADTGFENVNEIGVFGPIRLPGAGLATAAAVAPAGNQLTAAAGEVSQVRAVAPTQTVPAGALRVRLNSLLGEGSTCRLSWAAVGP